MKPSLIQYKYRLNQLAELGWQEKQTTEYIEKTLPFKPLKKGIGKAKTGLLYKVGKGMDAILLRADIDALKTKDGPRHICGHSSHTAALMQALLVSHGNRHMLENTDKCIYFLFQPAEETYPSGAATFMKENRVITEKLHYAFATHVRPLMHANEIGLQPGAVMARGDYFEIKVKGKMSHVKNPQKGIDAIGAAAQLVTAFKKIQEDNYRHLRLNVGVIQGGRQPNTVADLCEMKGDIRLDNNNLQVMVKSKMKKIIEIVQKKTGTIIELSYFDGYPVLSNDTRLAKTITSVLSDKNAWKIVSKGLFSYGCEDFSFIANRVPSIYAFIGTGDRFDIHDENCIISDIGTENIFEYFDALTHWWFNT